MASCWHIVNPNPIPFVFKVEEIPFIKICDSSKLAIWSKDLKILSRLSKEMPQPLSITFIRTILSLTNSASTVIFPFWVNLKALLSKFINTWRKRYRSLFNSEGTPSLIIILILSYFWTTSAEKKSKQLLISSFKEIVEKLSPIDPDSIWI